MHSEKTGVFTLQLWSCTIIDLPGAHGDKISDKWIDPIKKKLVTAIAGHIGCKSKSRSTLRKFTGGQWKRRARISASHKAISGPKYAWWKSSINQKMCIKWPRREANQKAQRRIWIGYKIWLDTFSIKRSYQTASYSLKLPLDRFQKKLQLGLVDYRPFGSAATVFGFVRFRGSGDLGGSKCKSVELFTIRANRCVMLRIGSNF